MIRFESIDEAWGLDKGISPKIENPYKGSAHSQIKPTPPVVLSDACQDYIEKVYHREGIEGVVKMLHPEILWKLRAVPAPQQTRFPTIQIGAEEALLLLILGFALLMAFDRQ